MVLLLHAQNLKLFSFSKRNIEINSIFWPQYNVRNICGATLSVYGSEFEVPQHCREQRFLFKHSKLLTWMNKILDYISIRYEYDKPMQFRGPALNGM